ncbi:DUF952 domain-containing protein [Demequina capsici]|uniref:DUF952 domain-containing protein n=1 Tax=Demequina capsici TaxID=3075620 RepID=A0AA96FDK4_9MICO|nr:DUF952 domain-containing protein [Demequina sp. PMTSA13]WNM28013.1 DUF952 domain-containing protein [Demequina sp. PMTSA13]
MEIVHLALATDWDAAVAAGEYRISGRGMTLEGEGFIHCSTWLQLPRTAKRFYADLTEPLVALVMDEDVVRAAGTEVRYEGDVDLFPHIYGPIDPAWVTPRRASIDKGWLSVER